MRPSSEPPSPDPIPRVGWWPHVRAALVLLHLIVIFILALPSLDAGLNRAAWSNPTVQQELASWAGVLNNCGLRVTSAELEEHMWSAAVTYSAIHDPAV